MAGKYALAAGDAGHAACIFCRILRGEIPSYKVYESERVVAFLDAFPLVRGHALVVPKAHAELLTDMSAGDAAGVMEAMRVVAGAVTAATGAVGFNVVQNNGKAAGQEVPHAHFHIIPRHEGDGVRGFGGKKPTPAAEMYTDASAFASTVAAAIAAAPAGAGAGGGAGVPSS